MPQYAALDVSNEETAIHVIDETGAVVWRGKRASDPDVLTTTLRRYALDLVRVGLETGPLTPWLYHTCKALGLPIVCLDARHARAATALQRNKTDARDAETLAQLVRMGWYREARVKSYAAHAVRHLVGARAQLMGVAIDLSNQIRSTIKTFGLMAGKGAGRAFENRVTELIEARPTIAAIVEPLLAVSALHHRHSVQDEFVIVLSGEITLVHDVGETLLTPGMCAGFPRNGISHHLVNRSSQDAAYLEVGDRQDGDTVSYSRDDLQADRTGTGWRFTHKDGTPY